MSAGDKPWGLHFPDEDPGFSGYERELALAQYIAEEARTRPMLACAFGYPGVGKTSFCDVIARRLTQPEHRCQVLVVHCDDIASVPPTQQIDYVEQIHQQIRELRALGELFIVVLDEIDCIAHNPEDQATAASPGRGTVGSCAISMVRKIVDLPGSVFLVGSTNYPKSIDPAVDSRMPWKIYFPPPTRDVIAAIIAQDLSLAQPVAEQTTNSYLSKCEDAGTVPMTRHLKTAMRNLSPRICGPTQLADPAVLADILYVLAAPPTRSEVRTWVRRHEQLIADSEWQKDLIARAGSEGADQ